MIFVYRHGEKNPNSNCLSDVGTHKSRMIANQHRDSPCVVYTMRPIEDKHVAPLQTASNICTILDQSLFLIDDVSMLPYYYESEMDMLIVWHHSDMNRVLKHFGCTGDFIWPSNNFTGCLIIDNGSFVFDEQFLCVSKIPRWAWICCSVL